MDELGQLGLRTPDFRKSNGYATNTARYLPSATRRKPYRADDSSTLMYVNYENRTLNPHRQYTFLRSCDDETLLIAVNFDSNPAI